MAGSNRARVGLLIYVRNDNPSPILHMKDIFDRTISSFRFAPHFWVDIQNLFALLLTLHTSSLSLIWMSQFLSLAIRKRYWTSCMSSANFMKDNMCLLLGLVIRLAL